MTAALAVAWWSMVKIGERRGCHWSMDVGHPAALANQSPNIHRECATDDGVSGKRHQNLHESQIIILLCQAESLNLTSLTQRSGTLGIFTLSHSDKATWFCSPCQLLAEVPLHPVTYTAINMDTLRDLPRVRQGHPRVSSPSDLDEELFLQIFDWNSYCESTEPYDKPSSFHSPPSPRDLSKLITEIPSVIGSLSLEQLESEFFRMKAPFQSDDEAATTSDYSGQTPPDLVQGGGSTSPSDHSGSVFLEQVDEVQVHNSSDASLREVQAQDDEWTYPQTDSSKSATRGYPPRLQVSEDQTKQTANQGSSLKRRRSGNDLDKRQRQLADPLQTADVRKSGACLPCRVSKTRCHESGVCPTCRKAFPEHSHLACTRSTPSMAWPVIGKMPDVWSHNASEEERMCSGPRFYTGKPRAISVFFTKDPTSPSLRATVQAYRAQAESEENGSLRTADFPRDSVPSHQMLQTWVEHQIRRDHKPDFQHALQSFLLAYSDDGKGLPKHGLVSKVHKMNCFFRIWKASAFWCLDPANNLVNLPLSVQAQLRNVARKALYSLEHDILKELDDCIAQQGPPKAQERLAIWASMWQLIIIYRELLAAFKVHLVRVARERSESAQAIALQGHHYMCLADSFFPLLAVFYHYQFRTKKSLELSLDWLKAPSYPTTACQSKGIFYTTQQLLDCRKDWYQKIQASQNDMDRLLCVFIVNHELKKMNARKRIPKATASKAKGSLATIEDDCDDEAE